MVINLTDYEAAIVHVALRAYSVAQIKEAIESILDKELVESSKLRADTATKIADKYFNQPNYINN